MRLYQSPRVLYQVYYFELCPKFVSRVYCSYLYLLLVPVYFFKALVIPVLYNTGRCSVTIFLTDLDGTVTQHDGNVLAVDGFPFF